MLSLYRKIGFVCCLLFVCSTITAQTENAIDETKTFHSWTAWLGIDTSYELFDNFTVELSNQFRFDQNLTSFKSNFTQISGTYKLDDIINNIRKKRDQQKTKNSWRIGGGYRYVIRDRYSQNTQRVYADLTFKPHIEALKDVLELGFRNRYQHDFTWNRQRSRTLWRSKMSVKFPLKVETRDPFKDKKQKLDLTPFFAAEYFYQFHYEGNQGSRYRFQTGLSFELPNLLMVSENKRIITFKYAFQHSLNDDPEADHIIALLYSFSF